MVTGERNGLATVREVSEFLHISRAKLYLMMDRGEIGYVKLGKSRRLKWDDVDRLVAESTIRTCKRGSSWRIGPD